MRQSKRTPVRCHSVSWLLESESVPRNHSYRRTGSGPHQQYTPAVVLHSVQFRVSSAMEIPTVPNTPSNRDRKSSTRTGRRLRRANAIVLSFQPSLRSLTLNDGANRTTGHENLLNGKTQPSPSVPGTNTVIFWFLGDGSREMEEEDAMILDNGPSQGAQAHGGGGGQTVRYGKPIVASATVTTHSPMRGSFPPDIDEPSQSATPVGESARKIFVCNSIQLVDKCHRR